MIYDRRKDTWTGPRPECKEAFDEFERRTSGLIVPDTLEPTTYQCWRGLAVRNGCRRWHDNHRIYDDGDYRWSDLTLVHSLGRAIDHAQSWKMLAPLQNRVLINQPYGERTYREPTEGIVPCGLLVWDAPIESWWNPGGTIVQVIAAPSVMPQMIEALS